LACNFRELALTREFNAKDPDLAFYYMGFYIHSCPKMRYKGQYAPSFLLCPAAYSWHPIEKCRELLDKEKYSEFDTQNAQRSIEDDDLKMVGLKFLFKQLVLMCVNFLSRRLFFTVERP
jgi:arginyl-tRNA---protein transferase